MLPDVSSLRAFYDTPFGRHAAELISARIGELWGDVAGQSVLGLGFATPLLEPLLASSLALGARPQRVIALMPGHQGVIPWPSEQGSAQGQSRRPAGNLTGLVDEYQLPLPDASFDRVILAHILENSEETRALLREVWRVLTPLGRVIALVPNRTGLWAPFERTPFGNGRPYSRPQLGEALLGNMLMPTAWRYALHLPPVQARAAFRLSSWFERPGHRWWRRLAGVVIMEAEKQIYALPPGAKAVRLKPVVAARPSRPTHIPHQRQAGSGLAGDQPAEGRKSVRSSS